MRGLYGVCIVHINEGVNNSIVHTHNKFKCAYVHVPIYTAVYAVYFTAQL